MPHTLQCVRHIGNLGRDAADCLFLSDDRQNLLTEVGDPVAIGHAILVPILAALRLLELVKFSNTRRKNWNCGATVDDNLKLLPAAVQVELLSRRVHSFLGDSRENIYQVSSMIFNRRCALLSSFDIGRLARCRRTYPNTTLIPIALVRSLAPISECCDEVAILHRGCVLASLSLLDAERVQGMLVDPRLDAACLGLEMVLHVLLIVIAEVLEHVLHAVRQAHRFPTLHRLHLVPLRHRREPRDWGFAFG